MKKKSLLLGLIIGLSIFFSLDCLAESFFIKVEDATTKQGLMGATIDIQEYDWKAATLRTGSLLFTIPGSTIILDFLRPLDFKETSLSFTVSMPGYIGVKRNYGEWDEIKTISADRPKAAVIRLKKGIVLQQIPIRYVPFTPGTTSSTTIAPTTTSTTTTTQKKH